MIVEKEYPKGFELIRNETIQKKIEKTLKECYKLVEKHPESIISSKINEESTKDGKYNYTLAIYGLMHKIECESLLDKMRDSGVSKISYYSKDNALYLKFYEVNPPKREFTQSVYVHKKITNIVENIQITYEQSLPDEPIPNESISEIKEKAKMFMSKYGCDRNMKIVITNAKWKGSHLEHLSVLYHNLSEPIELLRFCQENDHAILSTENKGIILRFQSKNKKRKLDDDDDRARKNQKYED